MADSTPRRYFWLNLQVNLFQSIRAEEDETAGAQKGYADCLLAHEAAQPGQGRLFITRESMTAWDWQIQKRFLPSEIPRRGCIL